AIQVDVVDATAGTGGIGLGTRLDIEGIGDATTDELDTATQHRQVAAGYAVGPVKKEAGRTGYRNLRNNFHDHVLVDAGGGARPCRGALPASSNGELVFA